jgi:hypothetical protein
MCAAHDTGPHLIHWHEKARMKTIFGSKPYSYHRSQTPALLAVQELERARKRLVRAHLYWMRRLFPAVRVQLLVRGRSNLLGMIPEDLYAKTWN